MHSAHTWRNQENPKPAAIAELLTPNEVADQLNITRRTLDRWHLRRIGPPRIAIGRKVYYRPQSVRDWLAANEGAA